MRVKCTGLNRLNIHDLKFLGQYFVELDSEGNANGDTLKIARGTAVWSMQGFAIV